MINKVVLAALFVVGTAAPVLALPKINQFPRDWIQLDNKQYINSKIVFRPENNQIGSDAIVTPERSGSTVSYYSANCLNFYWILFAVQKKERSNNEVNFNQFEGYIRTPSNDKDEVIFEVCW